MDYYEIDIVLADDLRGTLIEKLGNAGCLGMIELNGRMVAYFPGSISIDTIIGELSIMQALLDGSGRSDRLTYSCSVLPEQDWNEPWKKGFQPIDVGQRFTVLPPWEAQQAGRFNLIVDPAMAFGTGHHETTRSCLVLLEKYASMVQRDRFLDIGTGTGILSLAAAHLGFRTIIGIDTDIQAVEAAKKNMAINELTDIDIREGSIADLTVDFDVIAANIVSGVLVRISREIHGHLRKAGIVVLSGMLDGQDDGVVDSMRRAGLKLIERYSDGKWRSLVMGSMS